MNDDSLVFFGYEFRKLTEVCQENQLDLTINIGMKSQIQVHDLNVAPIHNVWTMDLHDYYPSGFHAAFRRVSSKVEQYIGRKNR